ncbi:hypothetical protein Clacol_001343 [Clathrus columnatus]|uniref:HNH nuclease domain-containing protein n=1 Tax=Clathrus columnatus TaxID=1419009 RepID=A0AAV5A0Y9_9AGAM|nr:hypothetical protein Clacol_001343 [Clathrus columnatus]
MALILPILRLWLLFINLYGTFKAIKPPATSQRSVRPSSRVLQLRKRELKSRLAMWVVWASFFSLERFFDRTAAFVTPFYNELKCVALLFLLITRSHGAEAIFLHLIHPFVRPYVPAVDDILANLYSVYELLMLLLLIPWEYITEWWSRPWRWMWTFKKGFISRDQNGTVPETQTRARQQIAPEEGNEIQSRLRPRTQSQKEQFQEAEQHAKIIFEQIDEAQDQVRIRTRSTRGQQQPPVGKDQNENSRPSASGSVGLRTRKRLLEQSAITEGNKPGSRNTRLHHFDPSVITQAPASSSHDDTMSLPSLAALPSTRNTHSQKNLPESAYEVWIPPQSSLNNDSSVTPQSRPSPSPYRSPSPVYPPFPSAYPFTPRKSDSTLPPSTQIIAHNKTVKSRTRHTSMGHTTDIPEQHFIRKHKEIPSTSGESRASDGLHPEDFFQITLESSTIHTDMDVDTETLSTVNGSSATEESTYEDTNETQATLRRRRNTQDPFSTSLRHSNKRIGDDTESLKRSTRLRTNNVEATAVEKDEFGFTIQPDSPRRQTVTTRKKPLARVKPTVKSDGELLSDDTDTTESLKKKRKTKTFTNTAENQTVEDEQLSQKKGKVSKTRTARADLTDVPVPVPVPVRPYRVSTKQVVDPSSKTTTNKSPQHIAQVFLSSMTLYPRNIEVYNPQTQPPTVVAAFIKDVNTDIIGTNQHGSISIAGFHLMLNTVLDMNVEWLLYPANATLEPINDGLNADDPSLLPVGNYVILSPDKQFIDIKLTSESYRPRTLSLDISGSPRKIEFRERIRARDSRCCVTRKLVKNERFHAFRASHIFPIAHKDVWDTLRLYQYIEDDFPQKEQGPNSINSIQNGLLLRSDIHDLFDAYDFGINVDDGYRIHDFTDDGELDGLMLWINENVERKYRPSHQLLREHFRQCVLANVKGAGKRREDWIDPEENDDLSNFEIWGRRVGDQQPSRLELEIRSRLYHSIEGGNEQPSGVQSV